MASSTRSLRRPALLLALWASVTGGVLLVSSCYGRNCEASVENWGENPGEGRLLDENTWESQAVNEPWLHFPGRRSWIMDTRLLGARFAAIPKVYVSGSSDPVRLGANFTEASGNLAEITVTTNPGVLIVTNGTCAEYYARVVIEAAPVPPDPAPQADGGLVPPAEGGTTDPDAGDGGDGG